VNRPPAQPAAPLPAVPPQQIRRIQILSRRLVTSIFAGEYQSVFKGRGIEFQEVREYLPGDDVRAIDWNVTARMGRPFVKRFVEERELTVLFLLDVSASSRFGTAGELKSRLFAEICGVLAFAAQRTNDKVGLILFSDRIERFVPPKKGSRHVLRLIRDALALVPAGQGTDIPLAIDFLQRVVKHPAVVFLLSDFHAPPCASTLAAAARRHDLVAITATDPAERELPPVGLVRLVDAESGAGRLVDTRSPAVQRAYRERAAALRAQRRSQLAAAGIDLVEVADAGSCLRDLLAFFRLRERRRRR